MLPQVNIIRAKNADFLCFNESAGISNVLAQHGVWDELTIHFAKTLINKNSLKPVIFDIGANMGTFSIPIASYVENLMGTVHAFEPQRIIFYQLCGNIFLNRIDNIHAHNFAFSNIDSIIDVKPLDFNKSWNIGAYSLSESMGNVQPLTEKSEKVIFKSMNDCSLDDQLTLIKIDVEGMELEVLQGGLAFISKNNFPPILFEYNNGDPKGPFVLKLLTQMGYIISKYADSDYLAQHPESSAEMIN
jgi:FkbM family methyltransferase